MTRTERQRLGIKKWKEANCRASINACTGFGKTNLALTSIQRFLSKNPESVIRIIVPTEPLKEQWEENIEQNQIDGDIKVIIINTAASKPFYCDFLVLDECHKYSSMFFGKIFEQCNPRLILGLTATYERLDGKEKEIMDKWCPVCDTITIKEATENGWLSPYKEYKVLINVDTSEYDKANVAFMQHFAFFNFDWNSAMSCVSNAIYRNKYAKQMNLTAKEVSAHAFAWNKALQFRKNFIANHPKKLEIAKKIIEKRSNKKIITFNTSVKQCESYGSGYVVHSKKSKKTNKEILDEFSKCTSGQIHSSKMLIEGLDCPGLSVAIITGFNSSQTSKIQQVGRCIRKEPGKIAEVFTLVLKGCQDEKWYKKAMEGLSYIEINEDELEKVLNYEQLDNKQEKIQEKENTFRY